MKTAIIILSDPKGGEEALGRVFNALAVAHEGLQTGDQVEVVFNGAGISGRVLHIAMPMQPACAACWAYLPAVPK